MVILQKRLKERGENLEKSRQYKKKYYKKNRQEVINRAVKWNKNNPDKVKLFNKNYYLKNSKKINKKTRIYQEKNKKRIKKYYEKNRERFNERMKKYYIKNKEKRLTANKDWFKKNPEKTKEITKRYRESLKGQTTAKKYRVKNHNKIKKRKREYSKKNRVKIIKYKKQYYLNNPEKLIQLRQTGKLWRQSWEGKANIKKRRSIRRNARYQITPEKLLKAFNKTNGICPYCSCKITKSSFSLDHRKPISKDGTNHMNNLIACCKSCNSRKGDSSLKNFKTRQNLNNLNASIIQVQVASRLV